MDTAFLHQGLDLPQVALLFNRMAVGAFFAISGYHKLFNAGRHASLVQSLQDNRIPLLRFNAWFVPAVEFGAGVALTLGYHSLIAALLLGAICLVATCTDGLKRIAEWKPMDKADIIDDALYLPEVLYGIMLVTVILAGPGAGTLSTLLA